MRDDEFTENVEVVEAILEELEQAEITRSEGEQLKKEALQILDGTKELLDIGSGKVVVVEKKNGGIVEEPIELSRR